MLDRLRSPRGIAWCALLAAAIFQVTAYARLEVDTYAGQRQVGAILRPEGESPGSTVVAIWAYRDLDDVAAAIPADAKVLIVAGVPTAVAFDFYFLPRPLRVLVDFEHAVIPPDPERGPEYQAAMELFRSRLETRGGILTPESIEDGLDWADYCVVFVGDPPRTERGPALEHVLTRGPFSLFRVAH